MVLGGFWRSELIRRYHLQSTSFKSQYNFWLDHFVYLHVSLSNTRQCFYNFGRLTNESKVPFFLSGMRPSLADNNINQV